MDKRSMREWITALEVIIDNKLKKWKKYDRWENGENVQLRWQWEQTHLELDVFWEDGQEMVRLRLITPRGTQDFIWNGLVNKTFNAIQDRIGNLSMAVMFPIIDPHD
jgi:hypothetical protein